MPNEDKRAHLQMLQDAIARMGRYGFLIKGWTVTVVAALLALAIDKHNAGVASISLLPVIGFAALDAYYLCVERHFRIGYRSVCNMSDAEINFNMRAWDFRSDKGKGFPVKTYLACLRSWPCLMLYLPMGIIAVITISMLAATCPSPSN